VYFNNTSGSDKLLSEFGYDVPSIGFAVNVDAVAAAELKKVDFTSAPADVLVFGENGYEAAAVAHSRKLISDGMTAETAVFDTIEEAKAYAAKKGIKRVDTVSSEIVSETL